MDAFLLFMSFPLISAELLLIHTNLSPEGSVWLLLEARSKTLFIALLQFHSQLYNTAHKNYTAAFVLHMSNSISAQIMTIFCILPFQSVQNHT